MKTKSLFSTILIYYALPLSLAILLMFVLKNTINDSEAREISTSIVMLGPIILAVLFFIGYWKNNFNKN